MAKIVRYSTSNATVKIVKSHVCTVKKAKRIAIGNK